MSLSTQEKIAWLEQVPLLAGCSPAVIEGIAATTGEQAFETGQAVVRQGQVGNGLYIVVSGAVRIVAGSEELARLGPGEVLGELSVIDQQPRSASAVAAGALVLAPVAIA